MNLKTGRWLGCMVTGVAVCLIASSCRTYPDTQSGTGVKAVIEDFGERPQEPELLQKMKSIIIPEMSFRPPATIIDAVDFFKQASHDFDDPNIPPEQRGFSFILKLPVKPSAENESVDDDPFSGRSGESSDIPVIPAMKARNISLYDALKVVCMATDRTFLIEKGRVWVVPFDDPMTMSARTYPIHLERAGKLAAMSEEELKSFFVALEVSWPKYSSIKIDSYGQLAVKNTQENLALLDMLILPRCDFIVHVEVQILAFQAKDIEKLQLAEGVSEASLRGLRKAGKAKPVATASALTEENQEAMVKAVQEVIYPSEWAWVTADAGEPGAKQPSRLSMAGAFFEPQNFTMRETGMILQFIPQISNEDGSLIKMTLRPQWVTLERWEPLPVIGLTSGGKRQVIQLNQPVFNTTSFETQVNVNDGDTILLGTASTPDGKWVHAVFLTVKRVVKRAKTPGVLNF